MNLEVAGFRNLTVGERAHIGPECLIDLASEVSVGNRAALSPRVTVLTHADPGESALQQRYPREAAPTTIEADAWIGAGATVLHGVRIGARAVVGAGSLVRESVDADAAVAGVPAVPISTH
jgi:maltose O-acetyltransferase